MLFHVSNCSYSFIRTQVHRMTDSHIAFTPCRPISFPLYLPLLLAPVCFPSSPAKNPGRIGVRRMSAMSRADDEGSGLIDIGGRLIEHQPEQSMFVINKIGAYCVLIVCCRIRVLKGSCSLFSLLTGIHRSPFLTSTPSPDRPCLE